jgi:PhzF family phenazine biosynthesis protein
VSESAAGERARIYHVDAFADQRFAGNPAAVLLLERFPEDKKLQIIASENALPATAFLVRGEGDYRLRWFTPKVEEHLCGHATLASAAVVMERLEPSRTSVDFETASGPLRVNRTGSGYSMNLPTRSSGSAPVSRELTEALGRAPVEVRVNRFSYLAVFETPGDVRTLSPDLHAISRLDRDGVIVTAPDGGRYDFVSRYFVPRKGIPEDHVTGSAHCTLAYYWAKRLDKSMLIGFQASERGGVVRCRYLGDRVELEGSCAFYLEGTVLI